MLRDFVRSVEEQIHCHQYQGADREDLRILMAPRQVDELRFLAAQNSNSPYYHLDTIAWYDTKTGRLTHILGVELIETCDHRMPMVVRIPAL